MLKSKFVKYDTLKGSSFLFFVFLYVVFLGHCVCLRFNGKGNRNVTYSNQRHNTHTYIYINLPKGRGEETTVYYEKTLHKIILRLLCTRCV